MREQEPVTQTMKASRARQEWSRVLRQVARREARVVVEQDGVPVAAIVSTQDLERLQQLEEQRQRDLETLRDSGERFKDEPVDEVERQIALALAEVRAERGAAKRSSARSA
jgi:prevent-host-death family protein